MGKLDWRYRACAAVLLWATAPIGLSAQTLTTLHSFYGKNGAAPFAGLVQATDGNLYGTTGGGGANKVGTVFRISPGGGPVKTLYSFCSQGGCTDGAEPRAGLVQGSGGNFYGTTFAGGANGEGTVFKITPSGTLTTLYSFCSQSGCTDGDEPLAGLVQGTGGNFYGTTRGGGVSTDCGVSNGCGTVFRITPSGALTTLYSFCSQSRCVDGRVPAAGLVQATHGNLYGTTSDGGAKCRFGDYACGTVFKITPSGTLTTIHSFCSRSGCKGGGPEAAVVQATDGNFYGTTVPGGANG
jgi:uncharacterized repeat protein (TIGR03803 family)